MNSLQIKFNFQCNYNNHHRCYWFLVASFLLVNLTAIGQGSEFPERECCDLTTTTSTISPLSIPPIQATEKTITTSSASVQPISVGRSGNNIKQVPAILNCILARQLCFEDPSCSAILEIIPRVCGPIPVSCSTVTVTKCQAALRTLQAFPFFRPTCLCKEPGVDPDCNHFRDFLFDHPCGFVLKKAEKDPYPIDALPTCNHALSVCQQERKCLKLFEDFKTHCKVRDNKCRMDDRDMCHEAWTNLRLSPMFGCICPNNHMKRRCDKIFTVVNHNPCVGGQEPEPDDSTDIMRQHFHSTCYSALQSCKDEPSCAMSLQPILMNCDMNRCNRNACMVSLQQFYRGPHEDLSLDIAFCLCMKTTNRRDMDCMNAQEKLHPVCAQKSPDSMNSPNSNGIVYHAPPACHMVADLCKEDRECRSKLEFFEQACSVDSVTKKCAGRPSSCRQALIGILGTILRTNCACQGQDQQFLYRCLGWRKLLWVNPCVVEAQKDFHMKRLAELGLLLPTTTTTISTTSTTIATTRPTTRPPPPPPTIHIRRTTPRTTTTKAPIPKEESIEFDYTDPMGSNEFGEREHSYYNSNGNGNSRISNNIDDVPTNHFEHQLITTVSSTISLTTERRTIPTTTSTTTTTTEGTTTTTQAPRYCVAQRPHQSDQLIPEGTSKRIYSLDDSECSELCTCGESLALTCHALCVPFAPCRTAHAFYSHASPAYQAFRGRCLCYSGKFICMKPPQGDYTLPGGVFLLLGYSSQDETLLRPHTNLGVQDTVRVLQQYVNSHVDNNTQCTFTLYNMTDENIIIAARLPRDTNLQDIDMLKKEKEECATILKTISHRINNEHAELQSHRLLSIFKMSEVEVIWPERSGCNKIVYSQLLVLVSSTFITIFVNLLAFT